jgi:hypothetical protein
MQVEILNRVRGTAAAQLVHLEQRARSGREFAGILSRLNIRHL